MAKCTTIDPLMIDHELKRLENERSRLDDAILADDDRKLLETFDNYLLHRAETGTGQHSRHLGRLRIIAEHRSPPASSSGDNFHGVALADAIEDKDTARRLNTWIEQRKYDGSPIGGKTKTHYRTALRVFGRVITDDGPENDDLPPAMEVIPGGDPRDRAEKDVTPRPGEIHWWDPDVIKIIDEGCLNWRDKALIALAWDSGARPKELYRLTWGAIEKDGDFYRISVGGKDHPERDVLCVVATPYLQKWIKEEHPANDTETGFDAETTLWTSLTTGDPIKWSSFTDICKRIRDRLNVGKPLSLKWFRKSRASILAMRPQISQTELENRFGWVRGSQVAAHYIARFSDETDANIAEGDGLPEGVIDRETDDREDPAPIRCSGCEKWTSRHYEQCMFCTAEIIPEEMEEADTTAPLREDVEYREKRDEFIRHVVQDDVDPEDLDVALRFGDLLDGNEEVVERAEELREALNQDN